jgi:hypothetical protein
VIVWRLVSHYLHRFLPLIVFWLYSMKMPLLSVDILEQAIHSIPSSQCFINQHAKGYRGKVKDPVFIYFGCR